MRTCKKCGNQFEGHKCKPCFNIWMREYRLKYPERTRTATKKYYEKNKEKIIKYAINWNKENSDKRKKIVRKYYELNILRHKENNHNWYVNNKQRKTEVSNKWKKLNPELLKIYKSNRRNREVGKLPKDTVKKLFVLQKGKCPCCGENLGTDYHLDHIVPLFLGGKNEWGNVQLLKKECNLKKNKTHPVEFMQSRGFLL